MFKYEAKYDTEPGYSHHNWPTVQFTLPNDSSLPEQLQALDVFLKAAGYEYEGYLDIVNDEFNTEELENGNLKDEEILEEKEV